MRDFLVTIRSALGEQILPVKADSSAEALTAIADRIPFGARVKVVAVDGDDAGQPAKAAA
jgi:hypothetical protein